MNNANRTLPPQQVEYGLYKAWPASATDLATKTCATTSFTIRNPTAGALTFTIADKAGSPVTIYNAHSLAAGAEYTFRNPDGSYFNGGMTASASGAGLVYSMTLYQNTV